MVSKNNISRRKFLTVSAAATAALICAGCGIKVEPSTKTGSADPTFPATDQNAATRPVPAISTAAPTTTPIPAPTQTPVVTTSRCPKELVNDPYPGRCRRYIDTNGNGYCDLSEVG